MSARTRTGSMRLVLVSVVVVVLAAGAAAWWWWTRGSGPQQSDSTDMVAVITLNNRGVGLMERYDYEAAVKTFQKVVDMAPDWLPGKINLGIAQINHFQKPEQFGPIIELFQSIAEIDTKNPYAHYCLGICYKHCGEIDKAYEHFLKVAEVDPNDPATLWQLGDICRQREEYDEAGKYFERALEQNPYYTSAIYGLAQVLQRTNPKKADVLRKRMKQLERDLQREYFKLAYYLMGKYARVIGSHQTADPTSIGPMPVFLDDPGFTVTLQKGTQWTGPGGFGDSAAGKLLRAVRKRFGGVIVLLDYDQDNLVDVLLLGAVSRNGKLGDLLLHNEGKGKFRDVTVAVGLGTPRHSLAASVGDFDNDTYPDLAITTTDGISLFRNARGGSGRRFDNVTGKTPLAKLPGIFLQSAWVDLDQDADLDLLLARYAENAVEAADRLAAGKGGKGAIVAVMNHAEAPPNEKRKYFAPWTINFVLGAGPKVFEEASGAVIGFLVSDLDRDEDVDVMVLADAESPRIFLNDRVAQFHEVQGIEGLPRAGDWNGGLAFVSRKLDRSDLLLLPTDSKPIYLLNDDRGNEKAKKKWFSRGSVDSPPLKTAQAIDLDLDGWCDVVGFSKVGKPAFLHNLGGKLKLEPQAFGPPDSLPPALLGCAVFDADGDYYPDLLLWTADKGLHLRRNQRNTNSPLWLRLRGKKYESDAETNVNVDAVGTRIVVQSGTHWTAAEIGTSFAGLGQSRIPLVFGLARHDSAQTVRFRWPDHTIQAELDLPKNQIATIEQTNRLGGSCPLLFTWDGERYRFVTDFLGVGTLGEVTPDGIFQPRPDEAVAIPADCLAPKDGRYHLVIGEPMNEITYLDRLELWVVDHPASTSVYPDERFTFAGPTPSRDLLVFDNRRRIHPLRAIDQKGNDVTALLRDWDRRTVDDFSKRGWFGFAEEHWIEIDFGGQLEAVRDQPVAMFLAGWTNYPYLEGTWASRQAGVKLLPPVLEYQDASGAWRTLLGEMGFPAGLPRMMTVDLTGKLTAGVRRLRIRTNMQVYWDQLFVAPLTSRIRTAETRNHQVRMHKLRPCAADCQWFGCPREYSPDGRLPMVYDMHRKDAFPLVRVRGSLTRYGDVTELLRDRDDCFVILGPGDVVYVDFPARLPSPAEGMRRSFVLQTTGYCKMVSPFVATSGDVEPLPFRAMSRFPYPSGEHYPDSAKHRAYRQRYLTRKMVD